MANDIAPHNMTANNAPSPYVALASSEWTDNLHNAFCAFDGAWSYNQYWISNGISTGWIQLFVGSTTEYQLESYSLRSNSIPEPNRMPRDFTMSGSVDGTNWTVLSTVTGQTNWGNAEVRNFVCTTGGYFTYFRLTVSANNGDTYLALGEMYLFASTQQVAINYLQNRSRNRLDMKAISSGL